MNSSPTPTTLCTGDPTSTHAQPLCTQPSYCSILIGLENDLHMCQWVSGHAVFPVCQWVSGHAALHMCQWVSGRLVGGGCDVSQYVQNSENTLCSSNIFLLFWPLLANCWFHVPPLL